jgi:anti-anti-sigma factor
VREGQILYAKVSNTYVLKFYGDLRYTICAPLSAFIKQLQQLEFDDILIDLTEAEGIDSTNLGLLACIANLVQDRFQRKATVVSTNANVNRTLEIVGFYDVFTIDDQQPLPAVDARDLPRVTDQEREIADAILKAHRTLAQLNEANREMFRSVVDALESELAANQPATPSRTCAGLSRNP